MGFIQYYHFNTDNKYKWYQITEKQIFSWNEKLKKSKMDKITIIKLFLENNFIYNSQNVIGHYYLINDFLIISLIHNHQRIIIHYHYSMFNSSFPIISNIDEIWIKNLMKFKKNLLYLLIK